MKIALVHDFLKEYGGAERVLEALHEIWPEAPIYTSFVDWPGLGPHAERIRKWKVKTACNRVKPCRWLIRKLHSPLRFLLPLVWESFDFQGFDVVISSSGWGICRGIITRPETIHICYLHHPPRHLYGYQTALEWQRYWPVRVYGHLINHYLRVYDYLAAQRVDYFIANSKETEARIRKFYRRESRVIYPPVSIATSLGTDFSGSVSESLPGSNSLRLQNDFLRRPYFLCLSRLARAKHIDLAIAACQKLGEPLVVVGKGREEKHLKSKFQIPNSKSSLKSQIQMLGEIADSELPGIYQGAKALIFPAEDEEFGLVPVEAMSFGVPVIAFRGGGVKETVIDAKTGFFFEELTVNSLLKAMRKLGNYEIRKEACQKQAQKFSQERFKKKIVQFVNKARRLRK